MPLKDSEPVPGLAPFSLELIEKVRRLNAERHSKTSRPRIILGPDPMREQAETEALIEEIAAAIARADNAGE
jgi:hypothetical protein